MSYTMESLKDKITQMFPEIAEHHLDVGMEFSAEKNAYLVRFTRGSEELVTHLEKQDADECMGGIKCVYLGVQVAQFIKNFEARKEFERNAA